MDQIEALKADIAEGNCIAIVGTGVSAALSQGSPAATWIGFLKSGIDLAHSRSYLDSESRERLLSSLDGADTSTLLAAASEVLHALGGPASGEFAEWLRREIGYLPLRDPSVAHALKALDIPILTTNYDDLLEKATGYDHATWKEANALQLILSGKLKHVGHLHGYWSQPSSIILTAEQYELMLEDRQLEFLRQAMVAVNSILYIGFGAGLDDPNFVNLRQWLAQEFPETQIRHYRICRDDEQGQLAKLHRNENIVPVGYGSSHAELPAFLSSLAPSSRHLVPSGPSSWFQIVEEQVRETAILAPHVRAIGDARITDLMIPPVLLTVTQEQYIAANREVDGTRPSRCDPASDAQLARLLIAGDEHVGVSSALMWLAGQKCLSDSELIPVTVDYLSLDTAGFNPLRRQVLKELRRSGQWLGANDPLPRIVLVLDNVHLGTHARLERVIDEVCSGAYEHVLVGCRVGVDAELLERFVTSCEAFERRYVGRLARSDVRALVRLVDASREESLSQKAIEVVRANSLPSTPFTFSMIISAILRGESLMAATSPTTLLDAYLDLLLGRGGLSEDSRYGLDSFNRGYILGQLAELFVVKQLGALPQMEVVARLEENFRDLDWPEVPVDTIKDLQRRHILVLRGGEVSFAQSSYLHLFAARRGIESADFMERLKRDPLYYAPILAHYAALRRSDHALVTDLLPLIQDFIADEVPRSSAFTSGEVERRVESRSMEEIEQDIDHHASIAVTDAEEDHLVPLDAMEDDHVPFPLSPVDDQPRMTRMTTCLGLLSNLLRDTEIFPDHEARKHALTLLLNGWAKLTDNVAADAQFENVVREVSEYMEREFHLSAKRSAAVADDIAAILPLAMALGGISATLATRKLSRTVERCFEDDAFVRDPALATLGMFLLSEVQTPGWAEPLGKVYETHGSIFGVRQLLKRVILIGYLRTPMEAHDEALVQEFLTELLIDDETPRTDRERSRLRGRVIQKLQRSKLQWRESRLRGGESPLLGEPMPALESGVDSSQHGTGRPPSRD